MDAFERIISGAQQTLEVECLRDVAGSLKQLVALLDWLSEAGADLAARDVGFDTRTAEGQRTAALLREIATWEPERPRGRPGLASKAPETARRIAELRAQGLSLNAIAAALNAEGVPTPRGGAEWRASSVQAALGYRRPPPPPPGAPRHKPPKHGKGPKHPKPPKHQKRP
ncbi:MAG TPA: recombinase family protein [Solirubrobacteraceae bacterium]|nr:recombinase family protein [Solirubrobacteraceae bacterium]